MTTPVLSRTTLPNFFVIGAMRSGTTTLQRHLRDHPQIFMSDPKELHYFAAERNLWRGEQWYCEHFAPGAGASQRGEASVTYSQYPRFGGVPARIAALVPDARIVYLVRDPVERMRSHYEHEVSALAEHRPIDAALLEHPKYLDTSRYAMQLDQYLEKFDRRRILVVTTEALAARPEDVLRQVYVFLGVDEEVQPERHYQYGRTARKDAPIAPVRALRGVPGFGVFARALPAGVKAGLKRRAPRRAMPEQRPEISSRLRATLVDRLRDDVERLQQLFPVDVDEWGFR